MKVLFASAEVEPFAKVGGLADVAGSLPKALCKLGPDVKTVMPAYDMVVRSSEWAPKAILEQFPVRMNEQWTVLADLYEFDYEGHVVWLVGGNGFFSEVRQSSEVYSPGRDAYLFFAKAVLEACRLMKWTPDVVHAHDWHMGFLPVFLRESTPWSTTASIFTIHNLAYQGEFGPETIEAAGLPWSTFNMYQLETWGGVNFLKSGCAFADRVNTVSPSYAHEITTPEYGCRLEGLMSYLASQGRLSGILNGIDTDHHNPATDPQLARHYSVADSSGKAMCRVKLCEELGVEPAPGLPLVGVVSRLSEQKGFDLILKAAPKMLARGAALIVQALGDPGMAVELRKLQSSQPGRFRFVEEFNAPLAQRVYAGCDLFLMPSAFEPCGLGQMFAMRYGTVPLVRKTGGLGDTVFEGKNGFVFEDRTSEAFENCLWRAVETYKDKRAWQALVKEGMSEDLSWSRSAKTYASLYEAAALERKGAAQRVV
ncbi:MAG: glycogen synthase [Armatimonadetes bacterium]|nr:glycogen synthase [Armatimonadota bacterium]